MSCKHPKFWRGTMATYATEHDGSGASIEAALLAAHRGSEKP